MTSTLYKQILENTSLIEKLKNIVDHDDVVNHLISKDIISEKEYKKIWKTDGNKIDSIFMTLKTKKTVKEIRESFNILKSLYGNEFENELEESKQSLVDSIHQRGGFPKINVNTYISRISQEKKIKEKLGTIRWNNSLVVFGRIGEGKSYLVCECLRDIDLIYHHFSSKLFWINVGECENGSNILQPLTRLLRMINPKKTKLYELDELITEIGKIFATQEYKNSLVVLDNARSLEVIETFQRIGCKLIIITYFKNVKNADFVEINLGFTLNETIKLFSQYLSTPIENLSLYLDDIKEIHELCKGHPTTLSLLGVFLSCKRQHALEDKGLWNYIKEKIDKGEIEDLGNDNVSIIHTNFYKALKMCIDTINTEEVKQLYYQFAVFPKDANISTEVLEVFLNKKSTEVWKIMDHFEDRSLINSFYNNRKKIYIYVIHDLFLYYLKNETQDRKIEFHRKLIESYESRYEYHTLPDDNYILLFLGYHLKHAEMFDRFKKFLDLKFIEHKIKKVGVINMEQDLKMYKDQIIGGSADLKLKWEKCLKFIRDNKNELRQLEKRDIIQLALPTLLDDAQTLMDRNKANSIDKLYFTTKLSAGRLKSSYEFPMEEVATSLAHCFYNNVPKILIGLNNGDVLLYCSQTNKKSDRFQGHTELVFDLKVADDNSCFLSVSKDHTVKVWPFFNQRMSLDGIQNVASSPKCVQNEHFDAFSPGKKHNFKEFMYNKDGEYIISANFSNRYDEVKIMCTSTNYGKVIIWNVPTKEKLCIKTETGIPARNIHFSNDNSKIYYTSQGQIEIYEYKDRKLNYSDSIDTEDINRLYVTDRNTLIVIRSRSVVMYESPYESKDILFEDEEDIVCSSFAKDEYLAIGVNKNVFLYNISNGQLVEQLKHEKAVMLMTMDILKDDDNITSMISMKFDNNNMQQYSIMLQHYEQPRNEQKLVTTFWKNNVPRLALALDHKDLRIQYEFNTINEKEMPCRISLITFSPCGNIIILALEDGTIIEFKYKLQDGCRTLIKLNKNVSYLHCIGPGSFPGHRNNEISKSSLNSNYGAIIVVLNDMNDTNIHILSEEGHIKRFSWDFVIFQVFPMDFQHLLCIDVTGGIFIINLNEKSEYYKLVNYGDGSKSRKVCYADFCSKKNLVAILFEEKQYQAYHLQLLNTTKEVFYTKSIKDFTPTCCTFSYFGELLVLGSNDGRIMVFNLQKNNNNSRILNASDFSIKFMQFSKSELPILVIVGREVSWWNLESFLSECSNENDVNFDLGFWKRKAVHQEVPNLLQTVSLYSSAVHFSVSENFETFLVVDEESRIYVIKCLK